MSVAGVPRWLLKASPGCMAIDGSGRDVRFFVRMDAWKAGVMPRDCPVDLRLVAFDTGTVFTVATLVQLARDDSQTYDAWIDPGRESGALTLKNLGLRGNAAVLVVADRIVRKYPAYNTVYRTAAELYRLAGERAKAWDEHAHEALLRRATRVYPSVESLWKAGLRGEMHRVT